MAKKPQGGRSFEEFLKKAPSLEEAANDDSVELTGLVSRTTEGRFAITTDGGQTYELDIEAVRDFREEEAAGVTSAATIRVGRDALAKASLRPLKPAIKDLIKDPIKDIIHDGKQMITDPLVDKQVPKDLHTDPQADKPVFKDVHKDPLSDPVTFVQEQIGTGAGDAIGIDPGMGPLVNPAMNYGAENYAAAPFVMATPHQAPQHLLALQMGGALLPKPIKDPPKDGLVTDPFTDPPPKDPRTETTLKEPIHDMSVHKELAVDQPDKFLKEMTRESGKEPTNDAALKGLFQDTHKELVVDTHKELVVDTHKELVADTHKELIADTHKELVWDTLVEGGPNTLAEGVFDPRQILNQQGQPGYGYGYGYGYGRGM